MRLTLWDSLYVTHYETHSMRLNLWDSLYETHSMRLTLWDSLYVTHYETHSMRLNVPGTVYTSIYNETHVLSTYLHINRYSSNEFSLNVYTIQQDKYFLPLSCGGSGADGQLTEGVLPTGTPLLTSTSWHLPTRLLLLAPTAGSVAVLNTAFLRTLVMSASSWLASFLSDVTLFLLWQHCCRYYSLTSTISWPSQLRPI
jgi:hypothetical protein